MKRINGILTEYKYNFGTEFSCLMDLTLNIKVSSLEPRLMHSDFHDTRMIVLANKYDSDFLDYVEEGGFIRKLKSPRKTKTKKADEIAQLEQKYLQTKFSEYENKIKSAGSAIHDANQQIRALSVELANEKKLVAQLRAEVAQLRAEKAMIEEELNYWRVKNGTPEGASRFSLLEVDAEDQK